MIPYDPKTEICPYRTAPMRENWHAQRGLEDPWLIEEPPPRAEGPVIDLEPEESVKKEGPTHVKVPPKPEVSPPPMQEHKVEMTKEQRYRAANKEKLAQKARERRAKK